MILRRSHLRWALLASLSVIAGANEIAFVDVHSDDSFTIRGLDVSVDAVAGPLSFFSPNPMASQEWASTLWVQRTTQVELATSNGNRSGPAVARIQELEEQLRPLYNAMPKEEGGALSNSSVAYALHRHFSARRGWAVKGLDPANFAVLQTQAVTPDVKQVSKYIVPALINDRLRKGSRSVGLRELAVFAAILEHLVHSEMMNLLQAVYSLHGLSLDGARTEAEVGTILQTFMMVFAFGTTLEISSASDVRRSLAHLEEVHPSWQELKGLLHESRRRSRGTSYEVLLGVVKDVMREYALWQSDHCLKSKSMLSASPSASTGRVALRHLSPLYSSGQRPLFVETIEELRELGVAVSEAGKDEELLIANYLLSHAMCLPTASFHAACCPNTCEGLLADVEREIAAPLAEPERILTALRRARDVDPALQVELVRMAPEGEGTLPLHGRAVSSWLHRAFPSDCPAPSAHVAGGALTPNDWFDYASAATADTEAMISRLGHIALRFTSAGGSKASVEAREDRRSETGRRSQPEVLTFSTSDATRPLGASWSPLAAPVAQAVFLGASMFVILLSIVRLVMVAAHGPKLKSEKLDVMV